MHPALSGEGNLVRDVPHPYEPSQADTPYAPDLAETSAGAKIAQLAAENRELRAQVDQLHSERARLLETQRRITELLGSPSPDKLLHDLRNVLNERNLLKALVDES